MSLLFLLACAANGPETDGPVVPGPDDTAASDSADSGARCFDDADLDGFGDPGAPTGCAGRAVTNAEDCDDTLFSVHPGAPEVCNGRDDDCDGFTDDADDDLVDGIPFWADADADGFGGDTLVSACSADAPGVALVDGDCDDTDATVNPDADEGCSGVDLDCDGYASTAAGSAADCPGETCATILAELGGAAADGAYWLGLPSGGAAAVWCDMTTDGGGWTLGFLRNTADTGSQGDFGAGDEAPETLGASPETASTSAMPARGWLDLEALAWDELRLGAYASGAETYLSRVIPRAALRMPFGSDGYYLYGGETGYYWCGGDASYTDAGVGAVDNPPGAPADCKGHGSLGSGWDFSETNAANAGLTLCGGDASSFLSATWGGTWSWYGSAGAAQAIWVR